MFEELQQFLAHNRVSVCSILLDGEMPHSAALHYAHIADPLTLLFQTTPTYRKAEPILAQQQTPASVVVGWNESEMKTLQLDGHVTFTEEQLYIDTYYQKFPDKVGKHEEDIFFSFTPIWWRYTDWNKPEGKTILKSDGNVTVV